MRPLRMSNADIHIPSQSAKSRSTSKRTLLRGGVFYAALGLVMLVAVPYGSVEPWWRAAFQCAVFLLAAIAFVDFLFAGEPNVARYSFLWPMLALVVFGLIQTIPFGSYYSAGLARNLPRTISYDAHGTRVWVMEMLALVLMAGILLRYTTDQKRLKTLVYVAIGTALASAIFGIARQTMQHQLGFGLPYLRPGVGYAQFINRNHFAFLAEMGFGLALGIIIWRGLARERLVIVVGAILILAGAVVLANSRGGMLAVFSQVVFAGVLRLFVRPARAHDKQESKLGELTKSLRRSLPVRVGLIVLLITTIALGTIWIGGAPLVASLEAVPTEVGSAPDNSRWAVRRWDIWPATLKMIKEHPVAGVGFGGFWMAITRYHNASGEMVPQEAHNDYLEFLASGGLIALAIGVWFVFRFMQTLRPRLPSDSSRFGRAVRCGALVGMAGVAVHSLVDFGLHIPANAAIFVALMVISTSDLRTGKNVAHLTSRVRK